MEFILKRSNNPNAISAIKIVGISIRDSCPNWNVTTAIRLSEAMFTPSSRLLTHTELRIFGISGFEIATNRNDGRKIPKAEEADVYEGISWASYHHPYFCKPPKASMG